MTTNKKVIEHTLACIICGTENKMNEELIYQYTETEYTGMETKRVFVFECSECGYKEKHIVWVTIPKLPAEIEEEENTTIH
jgi:NMD protein affecting ribosome stability and mRNA decay